MEPQIRYVKSADGTTLATGTLGSGPPLVLLSGGSGTATIEMWWAIPDARASLEGLAARFTAVTYDARGTGLSDREVEDFSLEARVADLEAVFAGLALDRAFVVARSGAGPPAISFTARHPDLVRRLALVAALRAGATGTLPRAAASSNSSSHSTTSCIVSAWRSSSTAGTRRGACGGRWCLRRYLPTS